jgi:hypothetical protein
MRPALHQDGPGCISAVYFYALPGGDADRSGIQLLAQLAAEQVQHHAFSVTLLPRTARRKPLTGQTSGTTPRGGSVGNLNALHLGVLWSLVLVPEPFTDDLPVRADPAPQHPGIPQLPADLVNALPWRDAGPVRKLIIIKGLRAGAYRRHNALTMGTSLHGCQYAPHGFPVPPLRWASVSSR